ncbi:hypothetical protein BDZ45DRAFT_703370 [Acephala macrosclerotiorum]|nr:hypothetical protein BDZ45DRAFT_703370 [Acephala macrosclerotiorum]
MSPFTVVLILGAGPKIGISIAKVFDAKGYKIILASRTFTNSINASGHLELQLNLSKPDTIPKIFNKTETAIGTSSVVVHNGTTLKINKQTEYDFNVNATGVLTAAQQIVLAFGELPPSACRTFIYTGSKLNVMTKLNIITFGLGKSAAAHLIKVAVYAYKEKGYKFYYTVERLKDGTHAGLE